jgi:hypothetical protein
VGRSYKFHLMRGILVRGFCKPILALTPGCFRQHHIESDQILSRPKYRRQRSCHSRRPGFRRRTASRSAVLDRRAILLLSEAIVVAAKSQLTMSYAISATQTLPSTVRIPIWKVRSHSPRLAGAARKPSRFQSAETPVRKDPAMAGLGGPLKFFNYLAITKKRLYRLLPGKCLIFGSNLCCF